MNEPEIRNTPNTFWIVAGAALLWNIIGLIIYYSYVSATPAAMAQQYTPEQVALITNAPVWVTAVYGLAVTCGLLGSILLLLRSRWAVPMFAISLVCIVLQDIHAFVLSNTVELFGAGALIIPVAVLLIAIYLLMFARGAREKGHIR